MSRNRPLPHWPLRKFRVVEDSMLPALAPGDELITYRGGTPKPGELRVFRDPLQSRRWIVKRVHGVRGRGRETAIDARSDNPAAVGAVDSRDFGWIPTAGSYRVLWTVRTTR